MDLFTRRGHLTTEDNPDPRYDYIVLLSGELTGVGRVEVRYIPDRHIISRASFDAYLAVLGTITWRNLEEAAVAMLNDFNNEVIARWVQVGLSTGTGDRVHQVTLEDRQPKWDNAKLLARLRVS